MPVASSLEEEGTYTNYANIVQHIEQALKALDKSCAVGALVDILDHFGVESDYSSRKSADHDHTEI